MECSKINPKLDDWGVGLSIVRYLVDLHGGSVFVESGSETWQPFRGEITESGKGIDLSSLIGFYVLPNALTMFANHLRRYFRHQMQRVHRVQPANSQSTQGLFFIPRNQVVDVGARS